MIGAWLGVLALAATVAHADFTPPFYLSGAGAGSAGSARVTTDADGHAVATWVQFDGSISRLKARTISSAGVRGPIRTLSDSVKDARDPQIASDADGGAIVVWNRTSRIEGVNYDRIQARSIAAAGNLGTPQYLSTGGQRALDPEISRDGDGNYLAAWERWDGNNWRIQARFISVTGVLGPIRNLSPDGRTAINAHVATDADGDSIAVWQRFDGAYDRVQARSISASGTLGPVRTLSATGGRAWNPRVAIDADGDAVAVWYRQPGEEWQVEARSISSAGDLGPVQMLNAAGQEAAEAEIAMDRDGDAIVIWRRYGTTPHSPVQGRSISSTGALGPIQLMSSPGQLASAPELASDRQGGAVAVWDQNSQVHARTFSAASELGSTQVLSDTGGRGGQIATDRFGNAIAVWSHSAPGTTDPRRIQAATGP